MGLFDEVKVCVRLRGMSTELRKKTSMQTKDLDCMMEQYEISAEGRLFKVATTGDGWEQKPLSKPIDMEYHGWLRLNGGSGFVYLAKFTDGKLVEVKAVEQ